MCITLPLQVAETQTVYQQETLPVIPGIVARRTLRSISRGCPSRRMDMEIASGLQVLAK